MNEDLLQVFVYGTLRSGSKDYYNTSNKEDAHVRYLGDADYITPAKVRAALFKVDYYPGLCLSDQDEWVVGEVYLLKNAKQLHQLDVYEGCSANSPLPHEYKRECIEVVMPNHVILKAWVYVYLGDVGNKIKITSGDFFHPES